MQNLEDLLKIIYNTHCPIKTKKISKRDREKPWIDGNMKRLLRLREHHQYLYKNDSIPHDEYKTFRNYVTRELRNAKKVYFQNLFSKCKK